MGMEAVKGDTEGEATGEIEEGMEEGLGTDRGTEEGSVGADDTSRTKEIVFEACC